LNIARSRHRRFDVIRRSGESLLSILNDILDLSKIEAGKLELEVVEFDLEELSHEVGATFGATAEGKGLALEIMVERSARGTYLGDPVRLRQILLNLVSNGLKFTDKGGVCVRLGRGSRGLSLSVTDSGIGIAADKLDDVFGKYTQAEASTGRRFGGTGLGLSICRDLVELMGGEIAVKSAPGQGTTFSAVLPLQRLHRKRPKRRVRNPAAPAPIAERPLRILAAEDNQVNQLVLRMLLAQVGVDLTLVDNGLEAVEAAKTGVWDVILMDIQMPVMDGPTATGLIRAEEQALGRAAVPIIALTADAMSHQVEGYREAGMNGFVAKPIDAAKLYGTIGAILSEAASASAAA